MAREAREAPAQELVALRSVLDERAEALEAAACVPGARALLAPAARSAAGAERLYAELEHAVERPEFADVLRREQAQRAAAEHRPAPASTASSCAHAEVLHAEWWEGDADGDDEPEAGADEAGGADTAATAAEPPADAPTQTAEIEEATGAYLAVSHADAVDALAAFLAAYLAALPQAQGMDPLKLQKAVGIAVRELRKGRARRVLGWGRGLYRAGAVGYAAFAAFTTPWIAEAVVRALFTALRFVGGLW